MAASRTHTTTLTLSISGCDERELSLTVGYDFTPAVKGSWSEPSYRADAEITSVALTTADGESLAVPAWLQSWIEDNSSLRDSLVVEAIEQDASDRADAEERRAEDRAERLRGEA